MRNDKFTQNKKNDNLQVMTFDTFVNEEKWQIYTESEKLQLYKWWDMTDFQMLRNST